jgi:hypothetical protein
LITTTGRVVEFDDVRVAPIVAQAHEHREVRAEMISAEIPGAVSAYSRDEPSEYAPPESVIIAVDSGVAPFDLVSQLSNRIERFLMAIRLLKLGTGESMFEVRGETTPVRQLRPSVVRFRGVGPGFASPTQVAGRVIALGPDDVGRVSGVERLLSAAQGTERDGKISSFGMALQKFRASYHAYAWDEQIVDLATALEATLSGKQKDDVTLRLRLRASTLLSTAADPAPSIFKDIGVIYGLRSKLVHGGTMDRSWLLKEVRKLTTVADNSMDGVAVAHAVERLRDLVRRSLLARLCLADGNSPLWPIGSDDAVDVAMVDDGPRRAWRDAWRGGLQRIDALDAGDRLGQETNDSGVASDGVSEGV